MYYYFFIFFLGVLQLFEGLKRIGVVLSKLKATAEPCCLEWLSCFLTFTKKISIMESTFCRRLKKSMFGSVFQVIAYGESYRGRMFLYVRVYDEWLSLRSFLRIGVYFKKYFRSK